MQGLAEPDISPRDVEISPAEVPLVAEGGADQLRIIATSVAQAVVIMLGAQVCWSLVAYFVHNHSFDLGPLIVIMVYPLPIAVAAWRKHNALLSIMVVNLWLGWTIVGWIVVLIWACNWNVEGRHQMGLSC